jgi:hypothetical protein
LIDDHSNGRTIAGDGCIADPGSRRSRNSPRSPLTPLDRNPAFGMQQDGSRASAIEKHSAKPTRFGLAHGLDQRRSSEGRRLTTEIDCAMLRVVSIQHLMLVDGTRAIDAPQEPTVRAQSDSRSALR